MIRMLGETYCAGTAHPSHGSYDHFISLKHKAEVTLFEGLSDAGKQCAQRTHSRRRSKASPQAMTARKRSPWTASRTAS